MNGYERCLVTGASGFVGQKLCQRLKCQHKFVRALCRKNFSGAYDEIILADLQKVDSTSFPKHIMQGIDTVFHLAGIAHTKGSLQDYQSLNVDATQILLKRAENCGVKRFVYFSSVKACDPNDAYGHSKRLAEEKVLEFGQKMNIQVIIIRPALVYGRGIKGNLLQMIKAINQGFFPPVPNNGNQRSMISVEDLITATLLAIDANINAKIYTVTDGIPYSTRAIYNGIRKALRLKERTWSIPDKVLRVLFCNLLRKPDFYNKLLGSSFYSNEAICQIGFKPSEDFFKVLPSIIADIKKRHH